jgi:hypothetical protein
LTLARVPRTELESLELDEGKVASHLKLHFSNGVVWEFEVARAHKKGAKEFVTRLGGTIAWVHAPRWRRNARTPSPDATPGYRSRDPVNPEARNEAKGLGLRPALGRPRAARPHPA